MHKKTNRASLARRRARDERSTHHLASLLFSVVIITLLCFVFFAGIRLLSDAAKKQSVKETSSSLTPELQASHEAENPSTQAGDTENTAIDPKFQKEQEEQNQAKPDIPLGANGKKQLSPILGVRTAADFAGAPAGSDAKQIIAVLNATINELKETGGKCYFTLSQNGSDKTFTKPILQNAKNMLCEALIFRRGELAPGTWRAKVKYQSNTAEGESETKTFTVQ